MKNLLTFLNFISRPIPLIVTGFSIGTIASEQALDLNLSGWWVWPFVVAGVISFIVRRIKW
jgi:hypothetical protein